MKQSIKKLCSTVIAALVTLCTPCHLTVTAESPFLIDENGVLTEYLGTTEPEIIIPDGVVEIGSNCFFMHEEIEHVVLPEGLKIIRGFQGCKNMRAIEIPDSVTTIVNISLSGCESLTEIRLPKGLQNIESELFWGDSSLKAVYVNSPIESIGFMAFYDCGSLETLTLPDTITYIAREAFDQCDSLWKNYNHDGQLIVDGYLIDTDKHQAVLNIPEGVRLIASGAMKGCRNLIAVTTPDSLRYINEKAFAECTNMTQLTLNDGLLEIGKDALSQCSKLTEITIPASVTVIEPQQKCKLDDIYGMPNTEAERFANENGIRFHDISEKPAYSGKDMTMNLATDVWDFANDASVFGDRYFLTDTDLEQVRQALKNPDFTPDSNFSGSCFGMSLSVILAKNGLLPFQNLHDLAPDDTIISLLNYYQHMQKTSEMTMMSAQRSARQHFHYMVNGLKHVKDGASPVLLQYNLPTGSHAVVAYGIEEGTWTFDDKEYDARVLVWDPNMPHALTDEACLYYESAVFDWHIPLYNLTNSHAEGIIAACLELDVLNAYPYAFDVDFPPGDVNCDGNVTIADALLLQQFLLGRDSLPLYAQPDLNGDNIVDARDLSLLKRQLSTA